MCIRDRNRGVDIEDFDLTDEAAVRAYVREYRPTCIVHCAAYTAVDLSLIHIFPR